MKRLRFERGQYIPFRPELDGHFPSSQEVQVQQQTVKESIIQPQTKLYKS